MINWLGNIRFGYYIGISLLTLALSAPISFAAVQYTVKKGDNPSKIAKKHKIPVKSLIDANSGNIKNMKPGTKLVIPSKAISKKELAAAGGRQKVSAANNKKDKEVAAAKPAAKATDPAKTDSSSQNSNYHTVRKGETLASISRKYAISTTELKELNNMRSKKLKIGRQILVKRIGPKTYTVKKGENIWKIARKFDMDVEDLVTINELDSHDLHVGQKLYLEEKVDAATAENYQQVLGRNMEEELKKMAQTEEFTEKNTQDKVITFAKKMLNIPYKFGGTSILGIDCSAYVKKVYGLMGVQLPRTAREQFKEGEAIDKDELSIGDLVFFKTYASFPSHVGIYLGNNLFIHASSKGHKVTIDSLETPYYLKRFIGGKRLLTENEQETDPKG